MSYYAEDAAITDRDGEVLDEGRDVRLNDPAENREPLEALATMVVVRLTG
jgi:hypothetical protein